MPFDSTSRESNLTHNLRVARCIVAGSYVPFDRHDGRGGHCALGAIELAVGFLLNSNEVTGCAEVKQLAKFAKADVEKFAPDLRAAASVAIHNNTLGEESTLQMFDEAIADSVEQDMAICR